MCRAHLRTFWTSSHHIIHPREPPPIFHLLFKLHSNFTHTLMELKRRGEKKQNKQLPRREELLPRVLKSRELQRNFFFLLSVYIVALFSAISFSFLFFHSSSLCVCASCSASKRFSHKSEQRSSIVQLEISVKISHSLSSSSSLFQNMWMATRQKHSLRRTTATSSTSYTRHSSKQKRICASEVSHRQLIVYCKKV